MKKNRNKSIMAIIIVVALLSGFFGVKKYQANQEEKQIIEQEQIAEEARIAEETRIAEEQQKKEQQAFQKYNQLLDNIPMGDFTGGLIPNDHHWLAFTYCLVDLNEDEIPELVVNTETDEQSGMSIANIYWINEQGELDSSSNYDDSLSTMIKGRGISSLVYSPSMKAIVRQSFWRGGDINNTFYKIKNGHLITSAKEVVDNGDEEDWSQYEAANDFVALDWQPVFDRQLLGEAGKLDTSTLGNIDSKVMLQGTIKEYSLEELLAFVEFQEMKDLFINEYKTRYTANDSELYDPERGFVILELDEPTSVAGYSYAGHQRTCDNISMIGLPNQFRDSVNKHVFLETDIHNLLYASGVSIWGVTPVVEYPCKVKMQEIN